ncbi:MAG: hypothetical protein ACJ8F7_12820, partial [Gemmataceae bacterium]
VFFGTRQYGKVDHVPGLFYIATNFFYVQFVPLIPTSSVLVLDDGSQRGLQLGLSGKSVFFTYFRAGTLLGGILAMVLGAVEMAERSPVLGAVLAGVGLGAVLLFFLSYKLAKPSATRAVRLAVHAGIPPEVVAQYFVDADINPDDYPRPNADEVQEVLPADDEPRARRYRDDDQGYHPAQRAT